ncbi:ISAs1 family transposase [Thorsellia anophelis]|uniref:Transposase DDE domain-containing protein n=1 Tax=Thorsellia anophelis DSM 18579 TaxID=1123402 RepID=A0A1H9Z7S6_9GAMM|nr:ISAs1 family transposase [Thorsellia anophelis]SES77635.1 Transposase DDE domain-containing protein [Thorsellia anophelis DSM 18579]
MVFVSVNENYIKAHGRKERRSAYALPIELNEKLLKKWPHLKTTIAIVRDRQVKGKIGTYVISYYVCITEMTAEEALKIVRLHWGIENQLHWILDVTLKEDQSAVHDRIAAKNLASFRRITLNLLRITQLLEKKKEAPMTAKMMKSVFDINFRESVIFNLARG